MSAPALTPHSSSNAPSLEPETITPNTPTNTCKHHQTPSGRLCDHITAAAHLAAAAGCGAADTITTGSRAEPGS